MSKISRIVSIGLASLTIILLVAPFAAAQATPVDAAAAAEMGKGDLALGATIGAGLAIGLSGLASGLAQKDIAAAAVGAVAEDPSMLGKGILFVAIPETIVIFGFVVAFLLIGQIPTF